MEHRTQRQIVSELGVAAKAKDEARIAKAREDLAACKVYDAIIAGPLRTEQREELAALLLDGGPAHG